MKWIHIKVLIFLINTFLKQHVWTPQHYLSTCITVVVLDKHRYDTMSARSTHKSSLLWISVYLNIAYCAFKCVVYKCIEYAIFTQYTTFKQIKNSTVMGVWQHRYYTQPGHSCVFILNSKDEKKEPKHLCHTFYLNYTVYSHDVMQQRYRDWLP